MNQLDHPALDLLRALLDAPSPAGWEDALATIVRAQLVAMGYAPETDGAGNVVARLAVFDNVLHTLVRFAQTWSA